jgi:Leucine-rich repeat (LRR) protein
MKRQTVLAVIVLILVLFSACQPEKGGGEPSLPPPLSAGATTESPESVIFPDANLEAAIRNALVIEGIRRQDRALAQKPLDEPVTTAELAELTIMEARSKKISDLSGIEYCINLNELYLTDNNISDVSSLSRLTGLTKLDLGANQISDISPLSTLTELTDLDLYRNQISNISPLSSLTNLTYLFLFRNHISDISPRRAFWGTCTCSWI